MTTRVFILEDELIHAEALKLALEEAGLELAGECANADQAFELIAAAHPDVLLADIALPGFNNGITVAGRVWRELGIPHIYITSLTREEIICQAVETQPAGYLRKPVDPVNLRAAVEIALHIAPIGGSPSPEPSTPPLSSAPIFTRVGDKLVRIHPDDLLMVRADGENYIALVFEKREISCRTTLKEFCSQLPPWFIQIHRGYYINLRHLDAFHEGEQTVSLKGRQAPVGRSFRKAFLNSLRMV